MKKTKHKLRHRHRHRNTLRKKLTTLEKTGANISNLHKLKELNKKYPGKRKGGCG